MKEKLDEFEKRIARVVGMKRFREMRKANISSEQMVFEAFGKLYCRHYAESERAKARELYGKKAVEVFGKDSPECMRCGTIRSIEIHHIRPLSKGGTNDEFNIGYLCHRCHKEFHQKYGIECGREEFNTFCGWSNLNSKVI